MLISTTLISLVLATARIVVCAPLESGVVLEASDTITSGTGVEQRVVQENKQAENLAKDCGPPPPGGGCACCHHGPSHPKTEEVKTIESLADTPIIPSAESKGLKIDQEEQANIQLQGIRSESLTTTEAMNPESKVSHTDHSHDHSHDHTHDRVPLPIPATKSPIQNEQATVSDGNIESDVAPQVEVAGPCTGRGCGHHHGPINKQEFQTLIKSKDDHDGHTHDGHDHVHDGHNHHDHDHTHDQVASPILTAKSSTQNKPVTSSDRNLGTNIASPVKTSRPCAGSGCSHHHGPTNRDEFQKAIQSNHNHDHNHHDHDHDHSATSQPIRSEYSYIEPKEEDDHGHDHGHDHGEPSKYWTLGNSIEKNWNRFIDFFKNLWKSIKNGTSKTIERVSQFRRKTAKKLGMRPSGPIHEDASKAEKVN